MSHCPPLSTFGSTPGAVCADADCVVEVCDVVVTDDVSLPVDFDPDVRLELRGFVLAEIRPADQPVPIITTEQNIICDVKILRPRVFGRNADADILHPAVPHHQPAASEHVFQPCVESDVGVANGNAFEVVVIRRHHVEEPEIAVPIEDHFAVTGGFDDDGFLRSPVTCQHICTVERYSVWRHVIHPVGLVESRVNENHVARLHRTFAHRIPIACARPVVSLFETFE